MYNTFHPLYNTLFKAINIHIINETMKKYEIIKKNYYFFVFFNFNILTISPPRNLNTKCNVESSSIS